MEEAVQMYIGNAQVLGAQIAGRSYLSYEELTRAQQAGAKAFKAAPMLRGLSLARSLDARLEASLLYGGDGLGHASANSDTAPSATTRTVTFDSDAWAPGLFAPFEGSKVNFFVDAGTVVSSGDDAVFTIGPVDTANRAVTFTGTSTGCSALTTALNSSGVDVFFKGTKNTSTGASNEMTGLYSILTNTGTLFNIDAASYGLWRATSYPGNGRLTLTVVNQAVARLVGRVLRQQRLVLYCSPVGWAQLMSDMAAQRMFDSSYSSVKQQNGTKSIEFFSQNNAPISVKSHPMVKEGHAFLVSPSDAERVGSAPGWFDLGDRDGVRNVGGRIWVDNPDTLSIQMRAYGNQAIFLNQPATHCIITGLTTNA